MGREAERDVIGPHIHLHPIGESSVICYHLSAWETGMASSYVPRTMWDCPHSHFSKVLSPRPTRVANHPSAGRREVALVKKRGLCDKTRADGEPQ